MLLTSLGVLISHLTAGPKHRIICLSQLGALMNEPNDSPPFDPMTVFAEARERFGLDEADVNRAMAGLMPAFWAGLRHSAGSPSGLAALMAAFTSPDSATGASMSGFPGADALVERLFPNEAIRKAVLDQVAASTGLGRDALTEMMPVAATLMMGSTARNFAVGPARDWLDAFMAGYARGRPKAPPTPAEMMAPFTDAMNAFFSGFAGADRTDAEPAPRQQPEAAGSTESDDEATEAEDQIAMQDFFAASRDIQESQVRAFEQLFETFAPGKAE